MLKGEEALADSILHGALAKSALGQVVEVHSHALNTRGLETVDNEGVELLVSVELDVGGVDGDGVNAEHREGEGQVAEALVGNVRGGARLAHGLGVLASEPELRVLSEGSVDRGWPRAVAALATSASAAIAAGELDLDAQRSALVGLANGVDGLGAQTDGVAVVGVHLLSHLGVDPGAQTDGRTAAELDGSDRTLKLGDLDTHGRCW